MSICWLPSRIATKTTKLLLLINWKYAYISTLVGYLGSVSDWCNRRTQRVAAVTMYSVHARWVYTVSQKTVKILISTVTLNHCNCVPFFVTATRDQSCNRTSSSGGILHRVLWCLHSRLPLRTRSSTAPCSCGWNTGCGLSGFPVYNLPAMDTAWHRTVCTRSFGRYLPWMVSTPWHRSTWSAASATRSTSLGVMSCCSIWMSVTTVTSQLSWLTSKLLSKQCSYLFLNNNNYHIVSIYDRNSGLWLTKTGTALNGNCVVRLLWERSLGNSVTQLHKKLCEQHSEDWLTRTLQYFTVLETHRDTEMLLYHSDRLNILCLCCT